MKAFRTRFSTLLLAALVLAVVGSFVVPRATEAGVLYGSSNAGDLFTIDLITGLGTPVGPPGTLQPGCCTEIEHDNLTGNAYAQDRDGAFTIKPFDINTGAVLGASVFDGGAFTGLEYVGATLYGTVITGPGAPSTLQILDPVTGTSVVIGPTGVGPISGLAYDVINAIMYGIAGGNTGIGELYTIDLATGLASIVGFTELGASSLQFGPDGNLYAGGNSSDGGNLYRIDTATADATPVGPTGFGSVTGLTLVETAVPEPATLLLLALGLGGLGFARGRR